MYEPYITDFTMNIHNKIYQNYVNNLNDLHNYIDNVINIDKFDKFISSVISTTFGCLLMVVIGEIVLILWRKKIRALWSRSRRL